MTMGGSVLFRAPIFLNQQKIIPVLVPGRSYFHINQET